MEQTQSSDEEEDEVVREMDVYVTDMNDLNLLQFPLRPMYSECPDITEARIKPKHKVLELQVPYNRSIFSADNDDNRPSHQTMISSKIEQNSSLSIGVVRNGELHLTPLQDVYQIRPSFENVKTGEITEDVSDEDDDEKIVPIQQVHIRRKENERAESVRKHSYMYMKNMEKSEPWASTRVHDMDSEESLKKFEDMYHIHS